MLVKCTECGQEISDSARVCPHCGYSLTRETLPVDEFSRCLRKQRVIATILLPSGAVLALIASPVADLVYPEWYGVVFQVLAIAGVAAAVYGAIWHVVILFRLWWHRI